MIEFENVSFTYAERGRESLQGLTLSVKAGECLAVTGPSGCGKTSLLRLVNGLIPHFYTGTLSGETRINGKKAEASSIRELSRQVGSVFQNPKSQFFNALVRDELAFKAENYAEEPERIRADIRRVLRAHGMEDYEARALFPLSGGEKQKLCCLAMEVFPVPVMVLDEPSSNLDMAAIRELRALLTDWKARGFTILIAEHRLGYLRGLADRVLYLRDGREVCCVSGEEFAALSRADREALGLRAPGAVTFAPRPKLSPRGAAGAITAESLRVRKGGHVLLDIPSLTLPAGGVIGLIGLNGAGKSTFARCLCGLEKHMKGRFAFDGRRMSRRALSREVYLVTQDVNAQLVTDRVEEDILLSLHTSGNPQYRGAGAKAIAASILARMNLTEEKEAHPLALSGGQKQRAAIAAGLAAGRRILILDEPTSGLDFGNMKGIARVIESLREEGKTVFLITHDPELAALCCDYYVFFEKGRVLRHGPAEGDILAEAERFFYPFPD